MSVVHFEDFAPLPESGTCCVCDGVFEQYGNNPQPVYPRGRCCHACNQRFVMWARVSVPPLKISAYDVSTDVPANNEWRQRLYRALEGASDGEKFRALADLLVVMVEDSAAPRQTAAELAVWLGNSAARIEKARKMGRAKR